MPHQTPATLVVNLSDAVIRRHMSDPSIRQLRDPRYPLRIRFNQARTKASWFVVRYAGGRDHWHKLGAFPEVTAKAVIAQVPETLARLAIDPAAPVGVSSWETVGDVLTWFRSRINTSRQHSKSRRSQVRTAINRHLLPALEPRRIEDLTSADLDEMLVWPMQARYAVSTIRQTIDILKLAFRQAVKVGHLRANPVEDVKLSAFLDARIKPKAGRLREDHLPDVAPIIVEARPDWSMLPLLVLLFGVRISEARLSKWRHFDIEQSHRWVIPEKNTKSRREHRLPLTPMAIDILRRYRTWQSEQGYTGAYLFPGEGGQPIVKSTAHDRVASLSSGHWSSHDLRKVARTAWADLGVDYLVSELLLNHALSDLDRTYIHTYVERQAEEALSRYHDWLGRYGISQFLTKTIPRQHD